MLFDVNNVTSSHISYFTLSTSEKAHALLPGISLQLVCGLTITGKIKKYVFNIMTMFRVDH